MDSVLGSGERWNIWHDHIKAIRIELLKSQNSPFLAKRTIWVGSRLVDVCEETYRFLLCTITAVIGITRVQHVDTGGMCGGGREGSEIDLQHAKKNAICIPSILAVYVQTCADLLNSSPSHWPKISQLSEPAPALWEECVAMCGSHGTMEWDVFLLMTAVDIGAGLLWLPGF